MRVIMDRQNGFHDDQCSLLECRLCGQISSDVVDNMRSINDASVNLVIKKMGVKIILNDGLPGTICSSCYQQISAWRTFVKKCIEVQDTFQARLKSKGTIKRVECQKMQNATLNKLLSAANRNESEAQGKALTKKSRFTLDYLRNKVGRELSDNEKDRLQILIDKGEDRAIYAFLFGSGTNQSWPCQLCDHNIRGTIKEVVKHYTNEHQAEALYPCQLCGKVIRSVHTYKRHRTAHLSEYECTSCNKVFQDRSKLLAHRVAHSELRPHECTLCGKRYKMASHLKSHKSRTHTADSDRFTCEICGRRFSAKGNLTAHVRTRHNEDRPYVCHVCGKAVKTKQALRVHSNSHSGIKQFSCSICEMSFTSRASMASHTRRHTGERPYTCAECGKSFTSSSARSSHKLHVHSISRQHVCTYCGKTFKVVRDLRVHLSVHTGEKPYTCAACGRCFRVAANFYAHRKSQHAKQNGAGDAAAAEFIEAGPQQAADSTQAAVNDDVLNAAIRQHFNDGIVTHDDLSPVHGVGFHLAEASSQENMLSYAPCEKITWT